MSDERAAALIARLKERAADPERRIDSIPSRFDQRVSSLDLGGLATNLRGVAADLGQLLGSIRLGQTDHEMAARAEELREEMTTPVTAPSPPPAGEAAVQEAEARIGVALPPFLRRFYLEVADGGVGPGEGLLSTKGLADTYLELLAEPQGELEEDWPQGLVPVVRRDGGYDCVEAATGRVVAFDFDEMEDEDGEVAWGMTFEDLAPSLEDWLDKWVAAPSMAEQVQQAFHPDSMVEEARRARAMIGAMSIEERRAMGLPDEGWERVVWGGIGLED
jgi:hypothetical protein